MLRGGRRLTRKTEAVAVITPVLPRNSRSGRGDWIRTSDPLRPVRYAEQKAIVGIDSMTVLEGHLSPRALGLVVEWASVHKQELFEDWRLARAQQPLKPIAPLE